jgi:hypothetical protein
MSYGPEATRGASQGASRRVVRFEDSYEQPVFVPQSLHV